MQINSAARRDKPLNAIEWAVGMRAVEQIIVIWS